MKQSLSLFRFRSVLFLLLCLAGLGRSVGSAGAWGAPDCGALGAGNVLPQEGKVLCNQAYAVGYSYAARDPLWVAEHLTASGLQRAEALHGRPSGFHPDMRLPPMMRAEERDYVRSGWGRGHMAPSGDMPDWSAREESFAFSNVVPQDEALNSGAWEHIESGVRRLAQQDGQVYVVTGPGFREKRGSIGPDQVEIPSSVWKAIYRPARGTTTVVVCRNSSPTHCAEGSVAGLIRNTGINPFPGLPPEMRDHYEALPELLDFAPSHAGTGGHHGHSHAHAPSLRKTLSAFERLLQ